MNGFENNTISVTLNDAKTHLKQLNDQYETIRNYIHQVNDSAQLTLNNIDYIFDKIKNHFMNTLELKRNTLKDKVKKIQTTSVKPLKQCEIVIEKEINKVDNYIKNGEHLLISSDNHLLSDAYEAESSMLGNLPAVPTIQEVPNITFQYDLNTLLKNFDNRIERIGYISKIGPIQIVHCSEKPGGCLIEWSEIDDDWKLSLDIQSYKLQRAYGNTISNPALEVNFKDCYIGNNTQFLSKDMPVNTVFTFRVCCLTENSTIWSAWSRPFTATTKLEPFMWSTNNNNYVLTNDNCIASKITMEKSILYSKMAHFYSNCSIEFTLLECDKPSVEQCIALVDNIDHTSTTLIRSGTFVLSSTGQLFIDGEEKLTVLPKFKVQSKVIFSSQLQLPDKLRVTVENDNKTVTYDWLVNDYNKPLFFAACFETKSWKISVE